MYINKEIIKKLQSRTFPWKLGVKVGKTGTIILAERRGKKFGMNSRVDFGQVG